MSNRLRSTYREPGSFEQCRVNDIKQQAEALAQYIEDVTDDRMRALAQTKLEEAVVWAVKGLTG